MHPGETGGGGGKGRERAEAGRVCPAEVSLCLMPGDSGGLVPWQLFQPKAKGLSFQIHTHQYWLGGTFSGWCALAKGLQHAEGRLPLKGREKHN